MDPTFKIPILPSHKRQAVLVFTGGSLLFAEFSA